PQLLASLSFSISILLLSSKLDSKNDNGQWSSFEPRSSINRGRYQGERAHPMALVESKVLILQFDHEEITRLLISQALIGQFFFDVCYFMSQSIGKPMEFNSFEYREMIEGRLRKGNGKETMEDVKPYPIEEDIDASVLMIIKTTVQYIQETRWSEMEADEQEFLLRSFLEGILQRGMAVRCQLLQDRDIWHQLVFAVMAAFVADEKICLSALDCLLHRLSDDWSRRPVQRIFLEEFARLRSIDEENKLVMANGRQREFVQMLKVVVGMTRVTFHGFETVVANRVVRKYNKTGNRIIRVVFRAEGGGYLRPRSTEHDPVTERMKSVLIENGVLVGGRRYRFLGSSNSQLRDYGVYFIHETTGFDVAMTRAELGRFYQLPSYSVALIRLGHCFTHTEYIHPISSNDVALTHEITGGKSNTGKQFVFSDGVGCMSHELADELKLSHGLRGAMSAVQIRYRGHKGVLVKNPLIDDVNRLMDEMGWNEEKKKMLIRPSQIKFNSVENEEDSLEIVRVSSPSPVYLNQPMINILDQVSQLQSPSCHSRVTSRMQQLLHMQLQQAVECVFNEQTATAVLQEMASPLSLDILSSSSIQSTTEPFLRSLLRAHVLFVIKRRLNRLNIRVPSTLGRTLLGVVDETGLLQNGQVFVSYSYSMSHKRNSDKGGHGAIVHTGRTLITKNPCISAGDVRMFDAVDIPSLRHLVDVIVFPQHGPRPHPDEMAGSDLDGDEYTVVWDPELFLDHNEKAAEYPMGETSNRWKMERREEEWEMDEDQMAEVYIDYCANSQLGQLSNNHLAASDAYGINSKAAQSLAAKIPLAMDYLKQGIAPERMTEEEMEDPDDVTRVIPAEKCTRKPSFLQINHEPAYRSRGIMGKLYEEVRRYEEAIVEGEPEIEKISLDVDLILDGWEKYERQVGEEMEEYGGVITSLLHRFGIDTEAELMSNCMLRIRNKISEKRHDDTTERVLKVQLREEIDRAKLRFYEGLVDWNSFHLSENVYEIRKKASAAYVIAYRSFNEAVECGSNSRPLLSFPWLLIDVLNDIKASAVLSPHYSRPTSIDWSREPIARELTRFVEEYCKENAVELAEFSCRWTDGDTVVSRSMREIGGLLDLSFVLCNWAKINGGIGKWRNILREEHLIALFLLYGFGEWRNEMGRSRKYINRPTGDNQQHIKQGSHLLHFLNYLSSHHFRSLPSIDFKDLHSGFLCRGEWTTLAEISLPSFLRILVTSKMDLNCVESEKIKTSTSRVMQLPS
ncbi:hypothetical protein PFISCL1PPCAC_22041, partial [Pristionchus fissidentatus]